MTDYSDFLKDYRSRDTASLWRSKAALSNQKGDVAQARSGAINVVLYERGYTVEDVAVRKAEQGDPEQPFDVWLARKFYRHWVNATQRGIEFTLSLEDMRRLLSTNECWYTGMKLDADAGQEAPQTRTLDRIDASKGYTPENTVACSNAANTLKNQAFEGGAAVMAMTPVQMLRMAQKMMERTDDQ